MLQRLRLCRASDTVFRREIDSQRQWGYGTCYYDSFPAAKECKTADVGPYLRPMPSGALIMNFGCEIIIKKEKYMVEIGEEKYNDTENSRRVTRCMLKQFLHSLVNCDLSSLASSNKGGYHLGLWHGFVEMMKAPMVAT